MIAAAATFQGNRGILSGTARSTKGSARSAGSGSVRAGVKPAGGSCRILSGAGTAGEIPIVGNGSGAVSGGGASTGIGGGDTATGCAGGANTTGAGENGTDCPNCGVGGGGGTGGKGLTEVTIGAGASVATEGGTSTA